jgi:uncharacterized LabA/DUF88 family protein
MRLRGANAFMHERPNGDMLNAAMLFIDAQNIFHGAKAYGEDDYSYDPVKLKDKLGDDYYLIRSYFFDSYRPDDDSKENFFYALDMNGYRVIDVPLRQSDDGYIEKGVDIRLTTEFIAHAYSDSYQTALLATGDDDYVRAVEHVQDAGKRVVIASWEDQIGRDMKRVCDEYVRLDDMATAIKDT